MSQLTEQRVLDALRPIIDPDLGRSIVDLGFVKDIEIEDGRVSFKIELTTPACPVKAEFERAAREAVGALPGVTAIDVSMTANTRGGAPRPAVLEGVRNVVAVASGKGGVGKSTVAVNLALALRASGASVGLLDADVYGPSIPLMLRCEGPLRVGPEQRIAPAESYGLRLVSVGFISGGDSPLIWRGPMVHGVISQFLGEVDWGDLDYLVIDLPPGTGDAALTVVQNAPLSGAVIVTTPQEVALIDARKGLEMFRRVQVPVLGLVENMSFFVCPSCQTQHTIFGEGGSEAAARELQTELLARIPLQPDVVRAGDTGEPTVLAGPESPAGVAFRSLAGSVARSLARLASEAPAVADTNLEWVKTP